jgi:redox-sensitive bicupin YhaK (pirin superfamily)
MSAGSGLTHSEFNASAEEEVHFLQIWIFPNLKDVTPRYDQRSFKNRNGKFTPLVGPMDSDEDILKIHQDAYIYRLDIEAGEKAKYVKSKQDNGIYFFQQTGSSNILDEILNERDGFGIESAKEVEITGISKSQILVIEVPML